MHDAALGQGGLFRMSARPGPSLRRRLAPASTPSLDSGAVAATLHATLDAATSSCSAAVHHLALLEVSHWEVRRGHAICMSSDVR